MKLPSPQFSQADTDRIENEQGFMETHQPWFPDTMGWLILSRPFG